MHPTIHLSIFCRFSLKGADNQEMNLFVRLADVDAESPGMGIVHGPGYVPTMPSASTGRLLFIAPVLERGVSLPLFRGQKKGHSLMSETGGSCGHIYTYLDTVYM